MELAIQSSLSAEKCIWESSAHYPYDPMIANDSAFESYHTRISSSESCRNRTRCHCNWTEFARVFRSPAL
jgi:hypothetical protein